MNCQMRSTQVKNYIFSFPFHQVEKRKYLAQQTGGQMRQEIVLTVIAGI